MPKPLNFAALEGLNERKKATSQKEVPVVEQTISTPELEPKSAQKTAHKRAGSSTQRRAAAGGSRWVSREPAADGQISIKASLESIERFRQMCADDRRTYGDMLEILMDSFVGKGRGG
ncbi:hypothetical protein [Thioclava sp. GXIMD4216]|uniref:ribbon-helix-helix protein n=1 Tax=Thioclava sp. GXIMD4216 TaxID=3131929 RepID=UPI0030D431D4